MSTMSVFAADRLSANSSGMSRLPSRGGGGHGLIAWAGVAAVALVVLAVAGLVDPPEDAVEPASAPPAVWADIGMPDRLFGLDAAGFGGTPRLYEARRHVTGGGRQDFLTYGQGFAEAAYLRLSLYRVGSEPVPRVDFFVDLTRTAALAGLSVIRSGLPSPQATRFGDFEVAELGVTDGTAERTCLGLRFISDPAGLRMAGLACPTGPVLDRNALTCLLDRLTLTRGGEDAALDALFAASDSGRAAACPKAPGGDRQGLRAFAAPQKVFVSTRKGAVPPAHSARE